MHHLIIYFLRKFFGKNCKPFTIAPYLMKRFNTLLFMLLIMPFLGNAEAIVRSSSDYSEKEIKEEVEHLAIVTIVDKLLLSSGGGGDLFAELPADFKDLAPEFCSSKQQLLPIYPAIYPSVSLYTLYCSLKIPF